LRLSRNVEDNADGKPVLLFEQESPELREASFVAVTRKEKVTTADQLKTWCVPPVNILDWAVGIHGEAASAQRKHATGRV
jgi:hypothetical protein